MPIFAEEIQNIRTMIRIYGMHTSDAQANAKQRPGMEDAGSTAAEGASCNLDGSGC